MKRPFYTKWTVYLILAVIGLFTLLYVKQANAELILEGAPFVGYSADRQSDLAAIIGTERVAGKWDFTAILLVNLADRDAQDGNRGFQVARVAQHNGWEVGIGYTFWGNVQPQAWNTDETFTLFLGKTFKNKWSIRLRHWSTGGTSSHNRGLDMLTIGRSFGR